MDIVIPNATSIGVFCVAAILLLLTPGPAVLYIVVRSVEQGRIAGLASVCGITTGTSDGIYALVAGTAGQWVKRNGHYVRWERYVTGGVFIGLGVTAAFAGSDDAA